ncbi:MAG: single-stranded DNA-binding protein [Chitinophagaceae bacterium]|nr:single-stranded DNA-binding protein [Nitrosomonas sp.]MCW5929921.1 single-stranded DNA-binding protein [Chitinophagaceae bacterium]
MASVNKAIILGNLTRDPEIRYMPNGDAAATINVATNEKYKDKSGEKVEKVEYHRIVMFGKIAEIVGEYLHKGSSAYFEGKIQTKKWTDKQGVERYTTEIIADRLQMLGGKRDDSEERPQKQDSGGNGFEDMDDDIPF